jgi:hypothetical protein
LSQRIIAVLTICVLCAACAAPHPCDTNVAYQDGMQALAEADSAMAARDFAKANTTLNAALAKFGTHYADSLHPQPNDDTGTQLMAARAAERGGDLAKAASMRSQVLESRLDAFQFASCTSNP